MFKRVVSVFLSTAILLANVFVLTAATQESTYASQAATDHFTDVPTSHWAYSGIMTLVDRGVISGYADGSFKPDALVSRSEFAVMMTRALQIPLVTDATPTFVDVGKDAWDFIYVETAKKYLTGYRQDDVYFFKGTEKAVREDMAVALVKALKLENQQTDVNELQNIFADYNDISINLQKYVLIAYKNNLIGGYPDGTFKAQQPITRAETASLLIRVLDSEAAQKVTFDGGETPQQTDILELPVKPHLRPVSQLLGWSTNGDFGIYDDSHTYPGVVTNSSLTFRDFVAAKQLVIEFNDNVSLSGVQVTNVHSPCAVLAEFQQGMNLNHFLKQEGNKFIFDLSFVTGSQEIPYALYFYGIENFSIRRVYLTFEDMETAQHNDNNREDYKEGNGLADYNKVYQVGEWIYFAEFEVISRINVNGNHLEKLFAADLGLLRGSGAHDLAQCGEYLVFTQGSYIYKLNLNTLETKVLISAINENTCFEFAVKDDEIYFIGTEGDFTDGIYKMNINAEQSEKILKDEGCWKIQVYDNQIFYSIPYGGLYCVNLDGSNKTQILGPENVEWQSFIISDGHIYFLKDDYSLQCADIDGENITKLVDSCKAFIIRDDYIIYSKLAVDNNYHFGTTINKMSMDNKESKQIYEENAELCGSGGNWIYFTKPSSSAMMRVRLDGTGEMSMY